MPRSNTGAGPRTPGPGSPVEAEVTAHHHDLEAACRGLLQQLAATPHDLAARWDGIDAALRDHLGAEEELLFPELQAADPVLGDRLRTDHARIRALLRAVGRDLRARLVCTPRLRELLELLTSHAEAEDLALRGWVTRGAAEDRQRELQRRLAVGRSRLDQRL